MTEFQPIEGKPRHFTLVTDIPSSTAGIMQSAHILGEKLANIVPSMFRQYDFYNEAIGRGALLLTQSKEKHGHALHPLAPTPFEPDSELIKLEVTVANFTRVALERYLGSPDGWKKAWHEAASINSQVRERKLLGHNFYLVEAATLETRRITFNSRAL